MKKWSYIILGMLSFQINVQAQDLPPTAEQQLESLADLEQSETEDDSYLQQLEHFRKNPVNLNNADAHELRELRLLNDLQIDNLLAYRRIFGRIIHIYELQAIPAWDIPTIRKLLPFISIETPVSLEEDVAAMFKEGEHSLLLRYVQVFEKQKGFDKSTNGTKYLGSPQKIFFRYRYRYKNLLQFGLVGDKDAGEQFFKGAQKKGFDFYSFHLFAKKLGKIQALALGDFTVNFGQGLVQWQSLAFKKSADVMGVKRQSPALRPYNSAGEFNFNRGIGITWRQQNLEFTGFGSIRKLSANFDIDSSGLEDRISSLLMSGNHRTESEVADRNRLVQIAIGGTARYYGGQWHIALNGIYYKFSVPLEKRDEPYNLFAIKGKDWYNLSLDYSYTYKNIHFFGETAIDKNYNKAMLNGILLSVDQRADLSIVHRSIAKDYQAVNANAFTEGTYPTNENGLYAGLTLRPASVWRIDLYCDLYRFPWLRFQADAPGTGRDFLSQFTYTPRRHFEIYCRFRSEIKQVNDPNGGTVTHGLRAVPKQNWRLHANYKISNAFTLRNRIELVWYDKRDEAAGEGFLVFTDLIYRPMMKPLSVVTRLQYFETDGYNARLYAYENDVLYGYSIPVSFDKGYRCYVLTNYDISKSLSIWLRLARTFYPEKDLIGSGLDEIKGHKKTELRFQVRYIF